MRRRRVDGYARRRHLSAIVHSRLARTRVNTRRVAHPTVMQNFVAARRAALDSVFDVERENGRKLLHRQRKITTDAAHVGHDATRSRRHAQPCHVRDHLDCPADNCGLQSSLRSSDHARELISFGRAYEIATLHLELFAHGHFNRRVDDDRLFRSADGSVIKALAG